MSAKDLRRLKWIQVENWDMLISEHPFEHKGEFVGRKEMYSFVDYIAKDIARKLNMPYRKVAEVIRSENMNFFRCVYEAFGKYGVAKINGQKVSQLKKMLLVPQVTYTVKDVVQMYELLSEEDKDSFRELIS